MAWRTTVIRRGNVPANDSAASIRWIILSSRGTSDPKKVSVATRARVTVCDEIDPTKATDPERVCEIREANEPVKVKADVKARKVFRLNFPAKVSVAESLYVIAIFTVPEKSKAAERINDM